MFCFGMRARNWDRGERTHVVQPIPTVYPILASGGASRGSESFSLNRPIPQLQTEKKTAQRLHVSEYMVNRQNILPDKAYVRTVRRYAQVEGTGVFEVNEKGEGGLSQLASYRYYRCAICLASRLQLAVARICCFSSPVVAMELSCCCCCRRDHDWLLLLAHTLVVYTQ